MTLSGQDTIKRAQGLGLEAKSLACRVHRLLALKHTAYVSLYVT